MKIIANSLLKHEKRFRLSMNNGFTLIEVLVALAILTSGIITIFYAFSTSIRMAGYINSYTQANICLQRQITRIRNEKKIIVGQQEGSIEGTKFYWNSEITPTEEASLKELSVRIHWKENKQTHQIDAITYLVDLSEEE